MGPFNGQSAGCPGLSSRGTGSWPHNQSIYRYCIAMNAQGEGGREFAMFIRPLFQKECGLPLELFGLAITNFSRVKTTFMHFLCIALRTSAGYLNHQSILQQLS
jgi:hypothetical protein